MRIGEDGDRERYTQTTFLVKSLSETVLKRLVILILLGRDYVESEG